MAFPGHVIAVIVTTWGLSVRSGATIWMGSVLAISLLLCQADVQRIVQNSNVQILKDSAESLLMY